MGLPKTLDEPLAVCWRTKCSTGCLCAVLGCHVLGFQVHAYEEAPVAGPSNFSQPGGHKHKTFANLRPFHAFSVTNFLAERPCRARGPVGPGALWARGPSGPGPTGHSGPTGPFPRGASRGRRFFLHPHGGTHGNRPFFLNLSAK